MLDKSNKIEFVNNGRFIIIIKSILFSVLLTLILLFIYAVILTYTNIPESTIPIGISIISSISILSCSIICMLKIKNNGIINGGAIGLAYMLILYLLSSSVQTGFSLNIYSIVTIISGIFCGMLGGIIGVNIKS